MNTNIIVEITHTFLRHNVLSNDNIKCNCVSNNNCKIRNKIPTIKDNVYVWYPLESFLYTNFKDYLINYLIFEKNRGVIRNFQIKSAADHILYIKKVFSTQIEDNTILLTNPTAIIQYPRYSNLPKDFEKFLYCKKGIPLLPFTEDQIGALTNFFGSVNFYLYNTFVKNGEILPFAWDKYINCFEEGIKSQYSSIFLNNIKLYIRSKIQYATNIQLKDTIFKVVKNNQFYNLCGPYYRYSKDFKTIAVLKSFIELNPLEYKTVIICLLCIESSLKSLFYKRIKEILGFEFRFTYEFTIIQELIFLLHVYFKEESWFVDIITQLESNNYYDFTLWGIPISFNPKKYINISFFRVFNNFNLYAELKKNKTIA